MHLHPFSLKVRPPLLPLLLVPILEAALKQHNVITLKIHTNHIHNFHWNTFIVKIINEEIIVRHRDRGIYGI